MQPQQVEPDPLQRRDACGKMCRRGGAPRFENVIVAKVRRNDAGERIDLRSRLGGTNLERGNRRGQLGQLVTVRGWQRSEQVGGGDAEGRLGCAERATTYRA